MTNIVVARIENNRIRDVLNVAQDTLLRFLEVFSPEQRKDKEGGCFCFVPWEGTTEPFVPRLVTMLGTVDWAKEEKYFRYCQEKALRLAAHPEHITSYQSRDPAKERWGGAIRGMGYIYSFSGFPESLDELFSVAVAYRLGRFDPASRELQTRLRVNQYLIQWLDSGQAIP